MVFQQFGGINGIIFYADQIFASAGELTFIELCMYTHILGDLPILLNNCILIFTQVCPQVLEVYSTLVYKSFSLHLLQP